MCYLLAVMFSTPTLTVAQTPAASARRLPPAGITIAETNRTELVAGAATLRKELDALAKELIPQPKLLALLPDAEIFHKAVDWALRYDEFFDTKQTTFARTLLQQGTERARQLRVGQAPWLSATGRVVRGYRSALDGSIQPYGLFVPADWKPGETQPRPLLVWLLGRGDKRTELAFLEEREKSSPPFQPRHTIVLIPYGRFCNATKFAGEVDVFEAQAAVREHYSIDPNRTAVGGFSMGGASAWHLATHFSGLWCAALPGAGFAETAIYTKTSTSGPNAPPLWEQKLWHWYNATDYAANLFNCPTVAYSGEIDPQKLAADLMEKATVTEGLKLEHIIGPQTAHKYHPDSQKELAERLDQLIAKGRQPTPGEVRLSTYTLRYPESAWVRIEGMERHWERADVQARRATPDLVLADTKNVSDLKLTLSGVRSLMIDKQSLSLPEVSGSNGISIHKQDGRWSVGQPSSKLRKKPGLTGPIDDAFMSPFLFVRPTGQPLNPKLGDWTQAELVHATKMWRDIFRGDAPVKDDTAVTEQDIATKNLVLWGDPSSNTLLARLLNRLPMQWTTEQIKFHGQTYDASSHAPILIFPNPLSPEHYVVLNSGIDFRDDAYGTNAKQTAKLPDWVILDLTTPPGPRWPGRIVTAGFFDEGWGLR